MKNKKLYLKPSTKHFALDYYMNHVPRNTYRDFNDWVRKVYNVKRISGFGFNQILTFHKESDLTFFLLKFGSDPVLDKELEEDVYEYDDHTRLENETYGWDHDKHS